MSTDPLTQAIESAEDAMNSGDTTRALSILEHAAVEHPAQPTVFECIAQVEHSTGHIERAKKAALRALSLDKTSGPSHLILGTIHLEHGSYDDAMLHFKAANQAMPNDPEILCKLGTTLFLQGEHPLGIVTLERALNLAPENIAILLELARQYGQLSHLKKAESLLLHAQNLGATPDAISFVRLQFKKLA